MTIRDKIERISDIKEEISGYNNHISKLKAEQEDLETEVLRIMKEDLGIDRTGTDRANVMVQRKVNYNIVDRDALNDYILANNALHLLQARLVTNAVAEYDAEGTPIPGLDKYERDVLVVRKRN